MPRSAARIFPVLLLLLPAIFVPLTVSGYSGLKEAASTQSYVEAAPALSEANMSG